MFLLCLRFIFRHPSEAERLNQHVQKDADADAVIVLFLSLADRHKEIKIIKKQGKQGKQDPSGE